MSRWIPYMHHEWCYLFRWPGVLVKPIIDDGTCSRCWGKFVKPITDDVTWRGAQVDSLNSLLLTMLPVLDVQVNSLYPSLTMWPVVAAQVKLLKPSLMMLPVQVHRWKNSVDLELARTAAEVIRAALVTNFISRRSLINTRTVYLPLTSFSPKLCLSLVSFPVVLVWILWSCYIMWSIIINEFININIYKCVYTVSQKSSHL